MFLNHFKNHLYDAHTGDAPWFTPNGCSGDRLKENLTHVNAVFADFDFKPPKGEPTGSAKPDYKQFVLDLDGLPEASFVVETGNGWHLYWLLHEPVEVDDSNRDELIEKVEGIHRYMNHHYGSDSGARDILRYLRVPGFNHLKQPEHPFMTTIIEDNEDARYDLDELVELIGFTPEVVYEGESNSSDLDIREVVKAVWAEKGQVATFNKHGHLVLDGEVCSATFIGRVGENAGNYIMSTSTEYPAQGNAVTYTATSLDMSTKEAYVWLVEKFGEKAKYKKVVTDDTITEREDYLNHLSKGDWDNNDWVKKLKPLRERYFVNFYKRVAQQYPHLKYAIDVENLFWDYDPETGTYKELGFQSVRSMIIRELRQDELDTYTTDTHVRRVLSNYIAETNQGVSTNDFTNEDNVIHVKNGWLNLKTLELTPHTPERLSLHTINVEYDPKAECPIYGQMIRDFQMPKDQVRVIDQYSGLILTNDISHQEMLVFDGRPGSGKSLIIETWMEVLGHKAGSEKLSMLRGDAERFMGESLVGKTLLFFDEANPKTENINESFMKFVSEKTIKVERKGQNKRELVRNNLKVVLALNEMPYHFPPGFDRRYRHIKFTRSFRDEGCEDKTIGKRIVEQELSGVLNRMIVGLHDLWKMGRTTTIEGEEERKRGFSLAADDLSAFLSDYFDPDPSHSEVLEGKRLLRAFKEEYPTNFNKNLSLHAFTKKLAGVRLAEFSGITTAKTRDYRGYTGLKLKEGYQFSDYGERIEQKTSF